MKPDAPRLTSLSHGGGCGCKIAPALLSEILRTQSSFLPPQLLVGTATSDDAAVYQINDEQALVATTDFFMPIVDDPFDFGRIAATNAISDIYAMGARPLLALALVAMPIEKLPVATIGAILQGGASICTEAGIPVAGGHSIDSVEPIYGLAVIGLAHPKHIKTNAGAQAGDVLILGKPLGIGVFSAALKKNQLSAEHYAALIATTTQLNKPGMALGALSGVHALTDVTGFGLLGHLLEMCRPAGLQATLTFNDLPLLPGARELAEKGCVTGASARNWAAYGAEVALGDAISATDRNLLTDPQTSGGLLVACAPEAAGEVLSLFHKAGFAEARIIGRMQKLPDASAACVVVR